MKTFLPWALAAAAAVTAPSSRAIADEAAPKRWNDDQMVAAYRELAASGGLEGAIRTPTLPKDPPRPGFLEALAWYAAGEPDRAGTLSLKTLDAQITPNVSSYLDLLKAKVERGEDNDYARTRTWKVIQKLTLLRGEMSRPERNGTYSFTAQTVASGDPSADAWDREHTLRSQEEFVDKVCRASYDRPIVVKFGNTNCTQCMLFEIIGSVKAFAVSPEHKDAIDVYKVWWGYRPDGSFAGRIRKPDLLNDLAKTEGVQSSPYFAVYRNGRRYGCGDAFPDDHGRDERLDTCVRQEFGDAPASAACSSLGPAAKEPRKAR